MPIEITLTVQDAYVTPILTAFNTLAGCRLSFEFDSQDSRGRWDFTIDPKGGSETNLQFAKRFDAELVRAAVRAVDIAEDEERYRTEISAILPPTQDVPDEVVE